MKLSICIPTYNARDWIEQCVESIYAHAPACAFEIIAVDDHSTDDTVAIVQSKFPKVLLLTNASNLGFSKTVNIGLRVSQGEYRLVLNNDTWIHPHAIDALVDYLDRERGAGIVGPKVVCGDGSLQQQCRRRIPTPIGALLYFTKLSHRFEHNPRFAQYLMTASDESQTTDVDAVSGACMMIRREVLDKVGLFDEAFYLYGEDLDLCWRTKLAGWHVRYHPASIVTHFGGQGGTGKRRMQATIEFHRAMWLFYRKHRAPKVGLPERVLVWTGIALKGALAVTINALRPSTTPGSAKPH